MKVKIEFPEYHPIEGQLYKRIDRDACAYEVYMCLAGTMYSLNRPGEYILCASEDVVFERLPTGTIVVLEQVEE